LKSFNTITVINSITFRKVFPLIFLATYLEAFLVAFLSVEGRDFLICSTGSFTFPDATPYNTFTTI